MKKQWIFAAALTALTSFGFTDEALDYQINEPIITQESLEAIVQSKGENPRIESFLVPAEAIEKLPKLKPLLEEDPGYNKIVLRLKGFPVEEDITMELKRLASLTPSAYETKMVFKIMPDGTMITSDGKKLQALVLSARGFLPGERVTVRFRTSDGSISEEVSRYPQPIIARDKNGKVILRAELARIIPTVYNIELPTMNEGEEYELKSTSLGEIVKSKAKYEKNTAIHYSPEVDGRAKGSTSRLEIKRKSEDPYIVTLPWGTLLKSYISGDLKYP